MTAGPAVQTVPADLLADAGLLFVRVGLVAFAGLLAAVAAAVYRWYAGAKVPEGLAVLIGVSLVALGLNTTAVLEGAISGRSVSPALAAVNVATFLAAALSAAAGAGGGDRLGTALSDDVPDATAIVRAVGRQITVTLPEEVHDMDAHDPVPPETKAELAGKSLSFPRRLTVEELRSRLVARLKADYGVGYVDVDLSEEGTVEYLAVGGRISGIGPTLPPGSTAVAVRADPPADASPGDVVQLWTTGDGSGSLPSEAPADADAGGGAGSAGGSRGDPSSAPGSDGRSDAEGGSAPERVTTAEVRGVAGETVTLAVDADEAAEIAGGQYRLVTLPAGGRDDREFAGLLRAAEETMVAVAVAEGSDLVGVSVGALAPTIVAIEGHEARVEVLPERSRTVGAGERLYALDRPDVLRRLEAAAAADGDADPPVVDTGDADD